MIRSVTLVVILLAIAAMANAQELEWKSPLADDYFLSQYIEGFPEFTTDDKIFLATDLFNDAWLDDISRPFDIRSYSRQTLMTIPSLNDLDITRLLSKIYPSAEVSDSLLLFTLDPRSSHLTDQFISSRHQRKTFFDIRTALYLDPNAADGIEYTSHLYRGTPLKTITKIKYYTDYFAIGITQAKGAGEPLYFDHIGGNISLRNTMPLSSSITIEKFVLGDYSLSFGEGLALGSGLFHGKSADAITPAFIRSRGITPYLSSSDYQFFRGGAIDLRLGIISIAGFYSDRKIDATVSDSGTITSLSVTGYHRTTNELARQGALGEEVGGSRIGINLFETDSSFLHIGATGFTVSYDKSVVNTDSLKTKFRGRNLSTFSLDASALFDDILLRTEYATTRSDASSSDAFVVASLSHPFELFDLAVNYRYLLENFLSPFGATFGDNTANALNERGLYIGLRRSLIEKQFSIEGYVDISTRTERTQYITLNPATRDMRLSALYFPYSDRSFKLSADVRLRRRESAVDDTTAHNSFLDSKSFLSGKIFASYFITSRCEVAMKLATTIFTNSDPKAKGIAATLIARYYPLDELQIETGISYYSSDSYDTRLFLTESEVYGSTLVQLYGEGNRYYILAGYNFGDDVKLSAKLAESAYTYKEGIRRMHLSFQAQVRL